MSNDTSIIKLSWLTNGEDNKFVIPNSEKYLSLINTGYIEGRTVHWNSMR